MGRPGRCTVWVDLTSDLKWTAQICPGQSNKKHIGGQTRLWGVGVGCVPQMESLGNVMPLLFHNITSLRYCFLVNVNCLQMEMNVLKEMVLGRPAPLVSTFRLSYYTILNLMSRAEGQFTAEHVIRNSFHQFQYEKVFFTNFILLCFFFLYCFL